VHQLLGEPDVHAERGQPGLGPVVQIAFDPPQFRRGRVDHLRARGGEPVDAGGQGAGARRRHRRRQQGVGTPDPGAGSEPRVRREQSQPEQQRQQAEREAAREEREHPRRGDGAFDPEHDGLGGQHPEGEPDGDVHQQPPQIAPRRGVGQQPAAALQVAHQALGVLGRPRPVGAGDLDAVPLPGRPPLPARHAAHAEQRGGHQPAGGARTACGRPRRGRRGTPVGPSPARLPCGAGSPVTPVVAERG
jgi:hypothetical protein